MNNQKQKQWIFDVSHHDFDDRVIKASLKQPVLVDLWAEWCQPCIVIAPVLQQLIEQYQGALLLAKVEVDAGENMKLAGHYKVRGFPTVLLMVDGEERARFSGAKTLTALRRFVQEHLSD